MAPPTFGDLGKNARDLLSKHYYLGTFNLKCTSSAGPFKFNSGINQNLKAKKIASDFEAKLNFSDYNTTLSSKWHSGNVLDNELVIEDKLIKGLKQTFKYSFKALDDLSNASIKNSLKTDVATAELDMHFKSAIPDVSPSFVFSHLGYLAGVDMRLDSTNRSVQRANVAVGYQVQDFAFCGLITNWGKFFSASVWQHLTDRFDLAGTVSWSRDTDQVAWAVGCKYIIDDERRHALKLKLDHLSRVCFSLNHVLSKGLQFTLCGMFHGPEPLQLGIGVELNH